MTTALLVEDDRDSLQALDGWMRSQAEPVETTLASSLSEARERLARGPVDFAIVDLVLPDGNGLELAQEFAAATHMIFVSGMSEVPEAATQGGAEFLPKPLDYERLRALIARAEARPPREEPRFGDFVGSCPAMRAMYREIERVAPLDATVFLCGETGAGKEVAARRVHQLSRRAKGRFEAINCGALAPSLVESELFGHEKGSFTGAHQRHMGVFERGAGGTVFLDELTEMPLELQVKLLRVLETGKLRRVGGSQDVTVDVRMVVATNRDPACVVAEGRLREDLLYRLYVLPIEIPPLRQRGEDVLELARAFLREWAEDDEPKTIAAEAARMLLRHPWPGNVRELRNTIYRAFLVSGEQIRPEDIRLVPATRAAQEASKPLTLAELERRHLLATLEGCDGDKKEAARVLGISVKTVYNKLRIYKYVEGTL